MPLKNTTVPEGNFGEKNDVKVGGDSARTRILSSQNRPRPVPSLLAEIVVVVIFPVMVEEV